MATQVDIRADASVAARLDTMNAQLALLLERQRKQEELFDEFAPIMKEVMATATTRLADLEQKGYFAFGREALGVAQRVIEGFTPEDVRALGGAIVSILETVRALTQPEVLAVASQAGEVLAHADRAAPVGIFGMVRATRDDEVQRGMSVLLEILRHVGRATQVVERQKLDAARAEAPRQLEATTRKMPAGLAATAPRTARPSGTPATTAAAKKPAASCATPSNKPAVAATTIDGFAFTAEGHLVDPATWTRALGESVAQLQGVALTEAHWKVLDFARAEYLEKQASPNIRRITQALEISTKDLYALFPRAPARTVAKIAGIPKPVGCL